MSNPVEIGDLFLVGDNRIFIVWSPYDTRELGEERTWVLRPLDNITEWMWDYESQLLRHLYYKRLT